MELIHPIAGFGLMLILAIGLVRENNDVQKRKAYKELKKGK